jgi:fructokinase
MDADGHPLIFGEVLYDRFPDGSVVLGGAPFNVAWHLQAFGAAPLFVSRVGEDELGERIRAAMSRWGMNVEGLECDAQHATGTVDVRFENGEPHYDIVTERAYDYISAAAATDLRPTLIYHGTLALRGRVSAESLAALRTRLDAPVFMDVNLRPPWWDRDQVRTGLDAARWVKLNEDELELLGQDDSGTLEARAGRLRERHDIELLIVTRGARGALAFGADGRRVEVSPPAGNTVVDTVGAGDAFTSVTILGLTLGWPLQQTLERAQDFASAVVGVRGATVQERDFYRRFREQWKLAQR